MGQRTHGVRPVMIVVVVDGLDTESLEAVGARWAGGGDHPYRLIRAPTAVITPAASTPSAIGGVRPISQSPSLANSSQLPTPAA
jgi:hypothetical protein